LIENNRTREKPNHEVLVQAAVRWLLRAGGCSIAFSEFATAGPEVPDAIGFNCFTTIIIECKASRGDFLRDQKKTFRRRPYLGLGRERYYMAPGGMLKPEEMPDGWGLLEWKAGKIFIAKKPQGFTLRHRGREITFLVSMLRRIKLRLDPDGNQDRLNHWIKQTTAIRR
jgi:hypothetical protein